MPVPPGGAGPAGSGPRRPARNVAAGQGPSAPRGAGQGECVDGPPTPGRRVPGGRRRTRYAPDSWPAAPSPRDHGRPAVVPDGRATPGAAPRADGPRRACGGRIRHQRVGLEPSGFPRRAGRRRRARRAASAGERPERSTPGIRGAGSDPGRPTRPAGGPCVGRGMPRTSANPRCASERGRDRPWRERPGADRPVTAGGPMRRARHAAHTPRTPVDPRRASERPGSAMAGATRSRPDRRGGGRCVGRGVPRTPANARCASQRAGDRPWWEDPEPIDAPRAGTRGARARGPGIRRGGALPTWS